MSHTIRRSGTCENDVGDVAMATVAQLLRVLQVAVATSQAHHERLGVVEGGGLVVQAVGADGGFDHVELLQLAITTERKCHKHVIALKQEQVESTT